MQPRSKEEQQQNNNNTSTNNQIRKLLDQFVLNDQQIEVLTSWIEKFSFESVEDAKFILNRLNEFPNIPEKVYEHLFNKAREQKQIYPVSCARFAEEAKRLAPENLKIRNEFAHQYGREQANYSYQLMMDTLASPERDTEKLTQSATFIFDETFSVPLNNLNIITVRENRNSNDNEEERFFDNHQYAKFSKVDFKSAEWKSFPLIDEILKFPFKQDYNEKKYFALHNQLIASFLKAFDIEEGLHLYSAFLQYLANSLSSNNNSKHLKDAHSYFEFISKSEYLFHCRDKKVTLWINPQGESILHVFTRPCVDQANLSTLISSLEKAYKHVNSSNFAYCLYHRDDTGLTPLTKAFTQASSATIDYLLGVYRSYLNMQQLKQVLLGKLEVNTNNSAVHIAAGLPDFSHWEKLFDILQDICGKSFIEEILDIKNKLELTPLAVAAWEHDSNFKNATAILEKAHEQTKSNPDRFKKFLRSQMSNERETILHLSRHRGFKRKNGPTDLRKEFESLLLKYGAPSFKLGKKYVPVGVTHWESIKNQEKNSSQVLGKHQRSEVAVFHSNKKSK